MCNHQQQQKQSGEGSSDNFPRCEGLYPELSGFANQPGQTNTSSFLGVLGIEVYPHSGPVNMPNQPSPCAPPPSPGSRNTSSSNNWSQRNSNCNGNHQPDLLTLIIGKTLQFSATFSKCFVVILCFIMFIPTVSLLSKSLL